MASYYRKVTAMLNAYGCYLHRQGKGSHEIWLCPTAANPITVPKTLKNRNTANAILKQAGIDEKV